MAKNRKHDYVPDNEELEDGEQEWDPDVEIGKMLSNGLESDEDWPVDND